MPCREAPDAAGHGRDSSRSNRHVPRADDEMDLEDAAGDGEGEGAGEQEREGLASPVASVDNDGNALVNYCANTVIQRKAFPRTEVFGTPECGFGLRVLEDVTGGQILLEYLGEVITTDELHERMPGYAAADDFYFAALGDGMFLDAKPMGSTARFANHSCDPNSQLQKWVVLGEPRICLVPLHDLKAGTEITYNYQYYQDGLDIDNAAMTRQRCLCGSVKCSGTIGGRAKERKWDTWFHKTAKILEKMKIEDGARMSIPALRKHLGVDAQEAEVPQDCKELQELQVLLDQAHKWQKHASALLSPAAASGKLGLVSPAQVQVLLDSSPKSLRFDETGLLRDALKRERELEKEIAFYQEHYQENGTTAGQAAAATSSSSGSSNSSSSTATSRVDWSDLLRLIRGLSSILPLRCRRADYLFFAYQQCSNWCRKWLRAILPKTYLPEDYSSYRRKFSTLERVGAAYNAAITDDVFLIEAFLEGRMTTALGRGSFDPAPERYHPYFAVVVPEIDVKPSVRPVTSAAKAKEAKVAGPTDQLYCFCRLPEDEGEVRQLCCCDSCGDWYHTNCVNAASNTMAKNAEFVCPMCCFEQGTHGNNFCMAPRGEWQIDTKRDTSINHRKVVELKKRGKGKQGKNKDNGKGKGKGRRENPHRKPAQGGLGKGAVAVVAQDEAAEKAGGGELEIGQVGEEEEGEEEEKEEGEDAGIAVAITAGAAAEEETLHLFVRMTCTSHLPLFSSLPFALQYQHVYLTAQSLVSAILEEKGLHVSGNPVFGMLQLYRKYLVEWLHRVEAFMADPEACAMAADEWALANSVAVPVPDVPPAQAAQQAPAQVTRTPAGKVLKRALELFFDLRVLKMRPEKELKALRQFIWTVSSSKLDYRLVNETEHSSTTTTLTTTGNGMSGMDTATYAALVEQTRGLRYGADFQLQYAPPSLDIMRNVLIGGRGLEVYTAASERLGTPAASGLCGAALYLRLQNSFNQAMQALAKAADLVEKIRCEVDSRVEVAAGVGDDTIAISDDVLRDVVDTSVALARAGVGIDLSVEFPFVNLMCTLLVLTTRQQEKRMQRSAQGGEDLGSTTDSKDDSSSASASDQEPLYCYCRQKEYGNMVNCEGGCDEWFHHDCITRSAGRNALGQGKFECPGCSSLQGQHYKFRWASCCPGGQIKHLKKPVALTPPVPKVASEVPVTDAEIGPGNSAMDVVVKAESASVHAKPVDADENGDDNSRSREKLTATAVVSPAVLTGRTGRVLQKKRDPLFTDHSFFGHKKKC